MSCNLSWLHTVCVHLQHVLGNRVYALKGTDRFLKKREHTPQKKWSHDALAWERLQQKRVVQLENTVHIRATWLYRGVFRGMSWIINKRIYFLFNLLWNCKWSQRVRHFCKVQMNEQQRNQQNDPFIPNTNKPTGCSISFLFISWISVCETGLYASPRGKTSSP